MGYFSENTSQVIMRFVTRKLYWDMCIFNAYKHFFVGVEILHFSAWTSHHAKYLTTFVYSLSFCENLMPIFSIQKIEILSIKYVTILYQNCYSPIRVKYLTQYYPQWISTCCKIMNFVVHHIENLIRSQKKFITSIIINGNHCCKGNL